MDQENTLREELKESIRKEARPKTSGIDMNEVIIICVALLSMTGAVWAGSITQEVYSALMGAFLGYTFGRIFNHAQGKE